MKNIRLLAIEVIQLVIAEGKTLDRALEYKLSDNQLEPANGAMVKAMCYGVVRQYYTIIGFLHLFLHKRLKTKDTDVYLALMLGVYQILWMRVPGHAAVNETVKAVKGLGKPWAVKLVNGVLRQVLRRQPKLSDLTSDIAIFNHPAWLLEQFQQFWPDHWQAISWAGNEHPPMHLRVNTTKISADEYLQLLIAAQVQGMLGPIPNTITLEQPVAVSRLPGFADGLVSVQDLAAGQVALLAECQAKARVLDACAAPGGKAASLLELSPNINLTALDADANRLAKATQTLDRLGLAANCICGDAREQNWWDGELFDLILVDVPCSGTGVIRRHPDIKILRRPEDIAPLAARQKQILANTWQMLKPGGRLVYTTCSILPAENDQVIADFCAAHEQSPDTIELPLGFATDYGWYCLPQNQGTDGFFYSVLTKKAT